MLFNSVSFITIFLPAVTVGWYLLNKLDNKVFSKLFLVGMSFWFYASYNTAYLLILVLSMFINYLLARGIESNVDKKAVAKALVTGGVIVNLGALFYFKYFNFFIDNCNFFLHTHISIEKIALPVGISFFTFQQIAFICDVYRHTSQCPKMLDYACFASFFPKLISGPIELVDEFVPQLYKESFGKFDVDNFIKGFELFALGLAKKVLLADTVGILVDIEYTNIAYLDSPSAWAVAVFYTFRLYFDFSGYCNMASGIAMMLGFKLPDNFDAPLRAGSVKEFWRKWHITLGRFLGRYVYIPLGGNRKGKTRQCINLFIVFLLSGIWHGANWTFIIWGVMHGVATVAETLLKKQKKANVVRMIITFLFVVTAFSVFRADSISDAWLLLRRMFAGGFKGSFVGICCQINMCETYILSKFVMSAFPALTGAFYCALYFILLAICIVLTFGPKVETWIDRKGKSLFGMILTGVLFAYAFISLNQVSSFLYFNF